jgi:lysophospholipase L1-like esterase
VILFAARAHAVTGAHNHGCIIFRVRRAVTADPRTTIPLAAIARSLSPQHPMIRKRHAWLGVSALCAAVAFTGTATAQSPADRFEQNVLDYEAADRRIPPPHGAILLVGDSQFFRWSTLREDLPEFVIINRGIDAMQVSDVLHFTDRLVLPFAPRLIVLHAGGNDVHNGRSATDVLADFKAFVTKVRATLPSVPIAYSSITPGPGRWSEAEQRIEANRVIKNYVASQPGLLFIDLWDALLTPDGKPREDLWVEDRIHPNHAGYLIRARIMRPILGAPDAK